ncbi:peptidylprolyl isomerase [Marinobacter sp. BGYM27]|uniref:peptidylprolyl isomerase n=1 Tax=unclassified Marinobacter TaxID=83889 RepID=UPI0021A95424|nr:peptidylprolyl isomerase [Marinobacter sp. BGYM27]MDG5501440.1 peptidylprolyl isomerase [Marinobacter sp. BGYM27]
MKASLRLCANVMVVLMLTMAAQAASAARKPLDSVIAIVDDDVILQTEQDSRVRTVIARLNAQGTGLPPRDVLEERVLDQLILDTIQLQMAEKMGMRVSDNELNDTMQNIASRNGFDIDQFEKALAEEGLSYREAREQIRREMLISRVQQHRVDGRVRITAREVDNFLQAQAGREATGAEYLLGHILIAVDDFNDADEVEAAKAKAEDLRQQILDGTDFKQVAVAESDGSNALEGGVLGWRNENQLPSLVVDVAPDLEVGQPSELLQSGSGFHIISVLDKRGGDGAKVIEQSNVRHILIRPTDAVSDVQAEKRINDLYQQLEGGADFAALAKEYSDDKVSGSAGGSLGWVSPGEMVPAFEQAMNEASVGELKGPFRSRFGWHILQVEERRQKDIGAQVKESEARQVLYRRKFEVELQNWLREIREEAYVDIKGDDTDGQEDTEASDINTLKAAEDSGSESE